MVLTMATTTAYQMATMMVQRKLTKKDPTKDHAKATTMAQQKIPRRAL